jgi:hypothetical protein
LFSPNPDLAFLAAGPVRIMLSTPQGAGSPGANSILYFKVTDIAPAHATAVSPGLGSALGLTPLMNLHNLAVLAPSW